MLPAPLLVFVWSFLMLRRISMEERMSLMSWVVGTLDSSTRSSTNFWSVNSWIYTRTHHSVKRKVEDYPVYEHMNVYRRTYLCW